MKFICLCLHLSWIYARDFSHFPDSRTVESFCSRWFMSFFHFDVSFACKKLAIMIISLLTLTDAGCSFRILRLIRHCTDTLLERLLNSRRFVSNVLRYMCAKIYLIVKSFHKVIAKTKWCNFFGTQCMYDNSHTDRTRCYISHCLSSVQSTEQESTQA